MPRPRRHLLLLLVVLFATLVAGVQAAGSRRDRFRQASYPVKPLSILEVEGEIGAEAQFWNEKISSTGGGRVRYSNQFYQEYILGKARGYVYHPRFMLFSTQVKLGMAQFHLHRDNSGGSRTSSGNEELVGYDATVDLFRQHPVSATLGAHRSEDLLMGLFVDRYLTTTEGYNATVRWTKGNRRMDLTGTHTKTTDDGIVSSGETKTDSVVYNFSDNWKNRMQTDFQYRWQKLDQRFRADTFTGENKTHSNLETQDAQLLNRLDLAANRRSFLQSTFRYHEQENHSDQKSYFAQERLQLQHADNLRSYYLGSFYRTEGDKSTVDVYRAEAGVDHDLFKSLHNHFDLHGRRTDYGNVVENRYGATLQNSYRKNTALGVLGAGFSKTVDRIERDGVGDVVEVHNEEVTLDDRDVHYLNREDVLTGTISVTDRDEHETYMEGFDYEVQVHGRRTGIRLLHGGRLKKGDTVYVSYSVKIERDLSYYSDEQDISVRHDFERLIPGLSLYARRHDLWARDVSKGFHTQPLEYRENIVGLQQAWRDFTYSTEYTDHMEDENGYDQWRNTLEGNHSLASRLHTGWAVGTSHTDYDTRTGKKSERESDYHFANTHLDGTFGRTGFWKLEGSWTQETGRNERQDRGVLGTIGYTYRRLTVEGGGRFEQLDAYDTRQDRSQVFLKMRLKLGRRVAGENAK